MLVESDSADSFVSFKERKKLQIIYLISCVYFCIIFTIGNQEFSLPPIQIGLFFCYNICMQFMLLPESLPQMTVKQFLEEQLLIPRKIRHFLRIKKNILINQKTSSLNERWVKPGMFCQLTFGRGRLSPKRNPLGQSRPRSRGLSRPTSHYRHQNQSGRKPRKSTWWNCPLLTSLALRWSNLLSFIAWYDRNKRFSTLLKILSYLTYPQSFVGKRKSLRHKHL